MKGSGQLLLGIGLIASVATAQPGPMLVTASVAMTGSASVVQGTTVTGRDLFALRKAFPSD